jgi:Uma2 family endonuclease
MTKLLDEAQTAEPKRRAGAAIVLDLRPVVSLSDEQFYELCRANTELRIERTAEGEMSIMAPTGGETSRRNAQLIAQLVVWANQDRTGVSFDSSGGFLLPNGSVRSPDAAWVRLDRWQALAEQQKDKFISLCPDFVVELRSATDSLAELQSKMNEYVAGGARLGWLIDPQGRRVHVYRAQAQEAEVLEDPESLSGEPVLKGFVLRLQEIW